MPSKLLEAVILVGTLAGAMLIGKLFSARVAQARRLDLPWYTPYLSLPGILILLAVALPLVVWIFRSFQTG
jgi:hypothetical protein